MSTFISSKNALLTKSRAIFGKRLKKNDYLELMKKTSVSEVAAYLKSNTRYGEELSAIDEIYVHRGQLESVLRKSLFSKYEKLYKYVPYKMNNFYYYYIIKSEVEQILRCIMLLNTNSMNQFITELPGFLISHASFSLVSLAKVRNFDDLERVLKNSFYKFAIRQCRPAEGELINYSFCEMMLCTAQYDRIFELIKTNFKGEEKNSLEDAFNYEIDLLNLSFILRLKRVNIGLKDIDQYLLPYYKKLNKKRINSLISANNDEFVNICNTIFKGNKMSKSDLSFIEHYTKELKYNYNIKILYLSQLTSSVFYSLMVLEQIEIDNIITIIEGIRYKLDAKEISKLIII